MSDSELNSTITLTEYLYTRLYQLGVRSVQGVPGDFNLPALDYLESTGLKWSGNAAELTAGYAADGYARIKGIGALMTVFGVGELSAINAVAGSYAEKVPVVHIVGTPSTTAQDRRINIHHSLGDGDHRVFSKVSKHFTCAQANLRDPASAPSLIDYTLRRCVEESRPVYIELPFDMINAPVSAFSLSMPTINRCPSLNHELEDLVIQDIRQRLIECNHPVIVVDGFAERYGISDQVNQLLRLIGCPAVSTPFGQGIIQGDYEFDCGIYSGPAGPLLFMDWFNRCDLVLNIAPLKADSNTYFWNTSSKPSKTIEFDQNCISIFGAQYPGLKLKSLFENLLRSLESSPLPMRISLECPRQLQKATSPSPPHPSSPIEHNQMWSRISRFIRTGDVVITDIGTSWSGTECFALPADTILIKSGIWLSIGYALGACVGAAQARQEMTEEGKRPDGRTIVFEGDGSFQVTTQAISDVIRNKLDIVLFIINNNGYTIERLIHGMHADYNSVQPWNYTEAPKFYGAPQWDPEYPVTSNRVSRWDELENILNNTHISHGKGFHLIEIVTDAHDAPDALSAFIGLAEQRKPEPSKSQFGV